MSETADIYKQTQAAKLQQRVKDQFRKDQVRDAQWRQNSCSHLCYGAGGTIPCLDLVHNFPDERPRGICHACGTLIQPEHWEPAGPDKMRWVYAHPLYPVVQAMERADIGKTILANVEAAAIDISRPTNHASLCELAYIFARTRQMIDAQLLQDITPWMPRAEKK